MNSAERVFRTINNERVDRVPFSLWRHFPNHENTSYGLAKEIINFQKKFDLDIIKITPSSGYFAEAFGGVFKYRKDDYGIKKGIKEVSFSPIKSHKDWDKLKILNREILERELKVIKIIKNEIKEEVPIFQTVPNALTLAKTIREKNWLNDLKKHPDYLKNGLNIINNEIFKFCKKSIDAGANGIFFFTQVASYDFINEKEYNEFSSKYDYQLLNEIKKDNLYLILHIHGLNIMFNLLKNYPVDIINWHDRKTPPSLSLGKKLFKGTVLGGINESELSILKPKDIKKQVRDAIKQTNSRNLIIGPGCTIPVNVPENNIRAIKESILLNSKQ